MGDTNGDGFDDILVGDPDFYHLETDYDTTPYGLASLFLGPVSGAFAMQQGDARIYGGYWAKAGYEVAGAGDTNGDGLADLLVGAPLGLDNTGDAYLFLGPVSGALWADSEADARFWVVDPHMLAGNAVSSAGDVDGDGLDDILVGAYGDSSTFDCAGSAFLVLSPVTGEFLLTDGYLRIAGDHEYQETGTALASAGDLDGDGYSDYLIAAAHHASPDLLGGGLCVLFGSASGGLPGEVAFGSVTTRLFGTHGSQHYITSLSPTGDLDLDGFSDFLVGSPAADESGTNAGITWLIHGPVSGTASIDDVAAARFLGEAAGDQSGHGVAGVGDVDADGYGDLLVGAPSETTHSGGAGAAYLFYGYGL